MYRFIAEREDECSEDFNSSGERKPLHVDHRPPLNRSSSPGRFGLQVRDRWDIRITPNASGTFATRQAALFCGVQIHEGRPASFDAKAAETTDELLANLARNRRSARRNYLRIAD